MIFWAFFWLGVAGFLMIGSLVSFAAFFRVRTLEERVRELSGAVSTLREELRRRPAASVTPAPQVAAATPVHPVAPIPPASPAPIPPAPDALPPEGLVSAPVVVVPAGPKSAPRAPEGPDLVPGPPAVPADVSPKPIWESLPASAPVTRGPAFDWERFAGVQVFSWIGGFALFFALVFFVKYSFDQGLVSPPLRVTIGTLVGLGIIVGGLKMDRARYAITVQALTSSGIAILFANSFAAHALYHLVGSLPTFLLMSLITAAAFVLAVRLDARYVAAMGLLCGFLAPPLLSVGQDRVFGLFSYILLLDAGLVAVVIRRRWGIFLPLAAVATVLMQWGWMNRHFAEEKSVIASAVFLVFAAAFTAVFRKEHRSELSEAAQSSALIGQVSALGFGFHLLGAFPAVAAPGTLVLGHLVAVSFLGMAFLDRIRAARRSYLGVLVAAFFGIVWWIGAYVDESRLQPLLAALVIFGGVHAAAASLFQKREGSSSSPSMPWPLLVPLGVLLACVIPLARGVATPHIWLAVLLLNALGIAVAVLLEWMVLAPVFAVVTMALLGVWIGESPYMEDSLGPLGLLSLFGLLFVGAGAWLARRMPGDQPWWRHPSLVPAVLPFLLLVQIEMKLQPEDPSLLLVVACLFSAVLWSLVVFHAIDLGAVASLAGCFVLAAVHQGRPGNGVDGIMLAWDTGLPLAFLLAGLVFRRRLAERVLPMAVSALAAPLFFYLGYQAVVETIGDAWIGLLPAAWSLPFLLAMAYLVRSLPRDLPSRDGVIVLFAGVALFFVTLIFPLQFEKQWITLSWTFEAAALLWLHAKIPHRGLVYWASGLLAICFARLALNPEVFAYAHGPQRLVLNWFFYTYILASASFVYAAGRLKTVSDPPWAVRASGFADAAAVVLLFYLMNIEIGHAFRSSATGIFSETGSLARDMTYSIGWALFGGILLAAGIARTRKAARVGGLVLLSATCFKVFLHDFWRLGQLYRVGSFAVLAIIMILVSFLYQRSVKTLPRE